MVWIRFGVFAVTLLAMLALCVAGLQSWQSDFGGDPGELFAFLFLFTIVSVILFVCFTLPSFVIALGLLRASHAAIPFALLHDLLILGLSILMVMSTLSHRGPYYIWAPPDLVRRCAFYVVLGLAFAAEAAYIMRRAWKWRPAWPLFALLAAGLISAVTIIPHVLWAPLARDVQPLLTYVNAHWVKIPPGARVALGRSSTTQTTHTDHIVIQGENASWSLSAEHRPDGRWTFPGTHRSTPTFMGTPSPSTERRRLTSLDEARMLLLDCGVVDTDLYPERVVTQEFELYPPAYAFWFWSPLAQGRYRVYRDNRVRPIEFYLEQPREVP